MTTPENSARERAKDIFRHYFAQAFTFAGEDWPVDADDEIGDAVEAIIEAARQGRAGSVPNTLDVTLVPAGDRIEVRPTHVTRADTGKPLGVLPANYLPAKDPGPDPQTRSISVAAPLPTTPGMLMRRLIQIARRDAADLDEPTRSWAIETAYRTIVTLFTLSAAQQPVMRMLLTDPAPVLGDDALADRFQLGGVTLAQLLSREV